MDEPHSISLQDRELLEIIKNSTNELELYLNYKNIKVIPKEIGSLINLECLYLNRNNIEYIPEEIGNILNLRCLDIYGKKLKNIPTEITKLINLECLDLHKNEIKIIPTEIKNLINLEILDLDKNEIKIIPAEIGDLVNLECLYLGWNQIKNIPREIGNLVNLESFELHDNQVKIIPKEIGNLINLEYLNLENNPIAEIPIDIWKAKKPPNICLTYHPGLKVIPKELAGYIYLNNNKIPKEYCDRPLKEWPASWLLKEKNAELRRLLIQVIGYEKILAELNAIFLDNWREYSLFKIEQDLDSEPILLLKMICPSTNYIHVLRVPPHMKSARVAIKWVNYGIDPEEFSLET